MDSVNVRVLVVATFVAVLCGCKSDSPLDPLERASKVDAASAVNFTGVVGAIAAPAPAVRVTDEDGRPVGDVQVAFAVPAGSGTVNPLVAMTDAEGRATVVWTLGTVASTQTLKATVGALAPVAFTAKAAAGPPTSLERISSDPLLGVAGALVPSLLTVRVWDSFHNPVAGVTVSFRVASGGGTVIPTNPITDSAGSISASWILGLDGGVQTAWAEIPGASVTFTADAIGCPGATGTSPCTSLDELVFLRTSDSQIYRMSLDAKGLTQLTSTGNNYRPVWAPDGNRIAFIRFIPATPTTSSSADVFLMNADGSNLVRRTTGAQYYSVKWSPDGRSLALDGATGGDSLNIYTLSAQADGSGPEVLITNGGAPAWSPDGNKIAYSHGTGYYDAAQIYVRNADGSGAHRVTPDSAGWNWGPAWSPDGQTISFTRCINTCGIYTVDVAGSKLTALTSGPGEQDAAWSPDGKWLALSVFGAVQSIAYVPSSGGTPRTILSNASTPSWRPRIR